MIPHSPRDAIYMLSEIVVGLMSVVSNSLVLMAIKRLRILRTVTNYFVASLALADVLVGIVVGPLAVVSHMGLPNNFTGCVLISSLMIFLTTCTVTNLVAVTLDRHLAIYHPFIYRRRMTFSTAALMSAICWMLAIGVGMLPTLGWNGGEENFDGQCNPREVITTEFRVYLLFFGIIATSFVFMICVYLHIFIIILQTKKHIAWPSSSMCNSSQARPKLFRFKKETKRTLSIVYVVASFAICYLPVYILHCVKLFAPNHEYPKGVLLFATVLSHCNSFVNPIIYALRHREFRQAFDHLVCGDKTPTASDLSFSDRRGSSYCRSSIMPADSLPLSSDANTVQLRSLSPILSKDLNHVSLRNHHRSQGDGSSGTSASDPMDRLLFSRSSVHLKRVEWSDMPSGALPRRSSCSRSQRDSGISKEGSNLEVLPEESE